MLTSAVVFDRGFIAYEADGQVIVSPVAHHESLHRMGIQSGRPPKTGNFSTGQRGFMAYHRENVLLRSSFLEKL
jgi:putative restriction endonuclease